MPLSFLQTADPAEFVGRTPWSARDALVPLYSKRHQALAKEAGRRGRRPRTRGPPHNQCRLVGYVKTKWHWAEARTTVTALWRGWGGGAFRTELLRSGRPMRHTAL